jgi:hypothetical protein
MIRVRTMEAGSVTGNRKPCKLPVEVRSRTRTSRPTLHNGLAQWAVQMYSGGRSGAPSFVSPTSGGAPERKPAGKLVGKLVSMFKRLLSLFGHVSASSAPPPVADVARTKATSERPPPAGDFYTRQLCQGVRSPAYTLPFCFDLGSKLSTAAFPSYFDFDGNRVLPLSVFTLGGFTLCTSAADAQRMCGPAQLPAVLAEFERNPSGVVYVQTEQSRSHLVEPGVELFAVQERRAARVAPLAARRGRSRAVRRGRSLRARGGARTRGGDPSSDPPRPRYILSPCDAARVGGAP